jgi:hypothetical protein
MNFPTSAFSAIDWTMKPGPPAIVTRARRRARGRRDFRDFPQRSKCAIGRADFVFLQSDIFE